MTPRSLPPIVACAAWVLSSIAWHPAAGGQTSLRDRFADEAPRAWAEGERLSRDLDVDLTTTTHSRTEAKQWTERRRIVVKSQGDMILEETTSWREGDGSAKAKVNAVNDRQSFVLRRDDDAPWTVGYVGPTDDQATQLALDRRGRVYLLWPWRIANWSLPTMYASPGFRVENVEPVQDGHNVLAKLFFSYTPQNAKDPIYVRRGWVLLDPARRWSVKSCEAQLHSPNGDNATMTVSTEYRDSGDALPQRATFAIEHAGGRQAATESHEFTKYEHRAIPKSEFTMAAYGVKTGLESPDSGVMWILLLAIGVILLLAGIVVYRRSFAGRSST